MSKKEQEINEIDNSEVLENDKTTQINKDEYIAKLNDDLVEQKKKADEYFENLKRNMADFDNFKKRISKEKDVLYYTVTADIIADFLPIMDNFEKAMSVKSKDESFKEGIEMIYTQIKETFTKLGLEEIESFGKTFDPNLHEAVMHIEDDSKAEKEIVEVLRTGYKISDRVVRHAMVKVAN